MKKLVGLLVIILVLTLFSTNVFAYNYPNGKAAKPGDILVTSDTVDKGIVGHAALVTDSNHFIETAGKGHYPEIKKLSSWFSKRDTTKVVRINDSKKARDAALYGAMYDGSKIPYKITNNLLDNRYMYCSKLVFQAYAFTSTVFSIEAAGEGKITHWPPYNFLQSRAYRGVTPKVVYRKGMLFKGDI
ncbi:YiiX/YebB-like N1pC/P60 family cysteine hydrolase [Virgibacillus sp. Bac330]|uniref:YiiX/YebB-like N1pC/P60 family cysteine hydrolase n=1 Tax=Virgibacillus sp. Bac330 TaxID=2419841 RepID=UPI000EF526C1|nr:YiiX/YebB-like N1pC/P60 family cysteine hydrolase [Virgibacillus sp. Bac330]